jgi:hypothetical protein
MIVSPYWAWVWAPKVLGECSGLIHGIVSWCYCFSMGGWMMVGLCGVDGIVLNQCWRRLMPTPARPGSRVTTPARGRRDNRRGLSVTLPEVGRARTGCFAKVMFQIFVPMSPYGLGLLLVLLCSINYPDASTNSLICFLDWQWEAVRAQGQIWMVGSMILHQSYCT